MDMFLTLNVGRLAKRSRRGREVVGVTGPIRVGSALHLGALNTNIRIKVC